jgi:hypothetical protein
MKRFVCVSQAAAANNLLCSNSVLITKENIYNFLKINPIEIHYAILHPHRCRHMRHQNCIFVRLFVVCCFLPLGGFSFPLFFAKRRAFFMVAAFSHYRFLSRMLCVYLYVCVCLCVNGMHY